MSRIIAVTLISILTVISVFPVHKELVLANSITENIETQYLSSARIAFNKNNAVDGDHIVLAGEGEAAGSLYYYDGTTLHQIISRVREDEVRVNDAQIFGDYIVWYEDSSNPDLNLIPQVYVHQISTATTNRITSNSNHKHALNFDGKNAVWLEVDGQWPIQNIYSYSILTGEITRLTDTNTNKVSPSLMEDRLVWLEGNNSARQLYVMELTTGLITQISNTVDTSDFTARDGRIVWSGFDGAFWQIYLYDGEQAQQITNTTANNYTPDYHNKTIVWRRYSLNSSEAMLYRTESMLTEAIATRLDDRIKIYNDRVVWASFRENSNAKDLYMKNIRTGAITQINSSGLVESTVVISDKVIVWEGWGISNPDNANPATFVTRYSIAVMPKLRVNNPVSRNKPVLEWDKIDDAVKYNVYRDNILIGATDQLFFTDSSLANEGNYNYHIKATNITETAGPSSNTVKVIYDTSPGVASDASTDKQVVIKGQTILIGANANDTLSGISHGEYYFNNDPGLGMGAWMEYGLDGRVQAVTAPINLPTGYHTVYIRAFDYAGNVSNTISASFLVL